MSSGEQREHCRSSSFEEAVYVNSSFAEDRAQRALGHISGMVRKRDLSPRLGMAADFVAAGTGRNRVEDNVTSVGPGDVLFCAAHVPHGFEAISDDFCVWVLFYGPLKAPA